MTDRKKPPAPLPFPDMSFEEVLARLLQTDPAELADSVKEMREKEKEVERFIREVDDDIRRGARRARKRFRL
jgi:hypothetical protein